MMHFFTSILITFFLTAYAVTPSALALESKDNCCCEEIALIIDASIQNGCACCVPVQDHKLPNKTVQIQIKTKSTNLHPQTLRLIVDNNRAEGYIPTDRRRPLHLASNELYLKKRALLI